MVFDICGFYYYDAWSAYIDINSILTFLVFLGYLTWLVFIEFVFFNWIIIIGVGIAITYFNLIAWAIKRAMVGILKLLKVRSTTQTRISLVFCLLCMAFWGFAPRVAVFYVGWNFHIIPCFIFSFPAVAFILRKHFYTCKDFQILYSENEMVIYTIIILNGIVLVCSARLSTFYSNVPFDIASIIVIQVVCTPLCILTTVDVYMLLVGAVRITVVREHQVNQVAPIVQETIQMERKDRMSFECKICFEEYSTARIPKSLTNCDHTICEECVKNCFKIDLNRFIMCPICQQITVCKGGVSTLSTNQILLDVIDEVKKNE